MLGNRLKDTHKPKVDEIMNLVETWVDDNTIDSEVEYRNGIKNSLYRLIEHVRDDAIIDAKDKLSEMEV